MLVYQGWITGVLTGYTGRVALFDTLNPEQEEAARHTEGPLLVLAGAGSGKTKMLTHRIAYLMQYQNVAPHNILAVTFTNKAAAEMRERVAQLLGNTPDDRSFMPFLGTFHAICVRILREEAEAAGLTREFVIFDSQDSLSAIKQAMRQYSIDEKKYNPNSIKGLISSAKNELIDAHSYAQFASGQLQEMAADIFPVYQRILRDAQALDFDDLLFETVRLLRNNEDVREKWQQRFRYILIDEYQDTNHAQYQLVKLLAETHNNICVIGDDWQCLPPGNLVTTQDGDKPVEDIDKGESVKSASGFTRSGNFEVLNRKRFTYEGNIIRIKTASGKELSCTPNHILFSRWGHTDAYFVYLMHSQEYGYRIGIVQGTRFDGKQDDVGLRVRANQERADRMWILRVCQSREEAMREETLLAYTYGIPMLVFKAYANRSMLLSQESIDAIYREIDTQDRAGKLMADEHILFDYPHFMPQATTRNGVKKLNINAVLFGDKRVSERSPWAASRISANTSDKSDLEVFEELGHTVRSGRKNTYRVEIHNLDYGEIEQVLEKVQEVVGDNVRINRYAFLTDEKFVFMPASQIHPGMIVPVFQDGSVVSDKVMDVQTEAHSGYVYDLDVDKVHNYVASGLVTHNSVYSWRGANFRNILEFERDYPDAKTVKLEQNYRSTEPILEAAQSVITQNENRSEKNLWTEIPSNKPVLVHQVSNESEESRRIIDCIQQSQHAHRDIAVLYRTNAQSRVLEDAFIRFGVPYQIVGGVRFYERKEIKDMMAYIRLVYQPDDLVSFQRVVNTPPRGIGEKSVEAIRAWQAEHGYTLSETLQQARDISGLSSRAANAIEHLSAILIEAREKSFAPAELIEYLAKRSGYFEYLNDGSVQAPDRIENVQELISVAREYTDTAEFLEEVALIADIDALRQQTDGVTLMTLHAAKGLEFPVVFITGMEEGVFPHSRSLFDPEEMEEERRLCYVGMTRAMRELHLMHADSRMLYGKPMHNAPARFLSEVDEKHIRIVAYGSMSSMGALGSGANADTDAVLTDGDEVMHPTFGSGVVTSVEGDEITVAFRRVGTKKLSRNYAPLKKQ